METKSPPIKLAKKFRLFPTPGDLEFWRTNPARICRVRPANPGEAARSQADKIEHRSAFTARWIVLNRISPSVCLGRVLIVRVGRERANYSEYLKGLADEDLKALLA
jgi:hypothetical protein